jgi:hypothetical protein
MVNTNKDLTFMVAANHLSQAISQTQDFQMACSVKSTNTSNCKGGGSITAGMAAAADLAIEVAETVEGDVAVDFMVDVDLQCLSVMVDMVLLRVTILLLTGATFL